MKIQLDDPRLTAYALDELDDASRAEFEALLNDDEEARGEIEAIRETAQVIASELAGEPEAMLAPEQRRNILAASEVRQTVPPVRRWWPRLAVAGICFVIAAAGIGAVLLSGNPMTRQVLPPPLTMGFKPEMAYTAPASPPEVAAPPPVSVPAEQKTEPQVEPVTPPAPAASVPPAPAPETQQSAPTPASSPAPKPAEEMAPLDIKLPKPMFVGTPKTFVPYPLGEKAGTSASVPPAPPSAQCPPTYPSFSPPNAEITSGLSNEKAEQRTKLNVRADFTDDSSFDYSYAETKKHSRGSGGPASDGADANVDGGQGVELYQAYIELKEMQAKRVSETRAPGTESYAAIIENRFVPVAEEPLSTFSIDVDTASYANVRRFLTQGTFPPKDVVRIEELIIYFKYDYPQPQGDSPFSVNVEVAACPWNDEHTLARIGLKGKVPPMNERPQCNLVFLLDVSGSMSDENKLPLLKKSMRMLAETLRGNDRIGIVTYCTDARVALESVSCDRKGEILSALDSLSSGGSTNGGAGIQHAYEMATRHFVKGGINRVILATDGDFNTGLTTKDEFVDLIQHNAKSGVFLTVLGFGSGNLKDTNLEALADKGNGHYAYIDSFNEARKVLLEQVGGTLVTIAKDVKIQVEFNPAKVGAYRLIGYENRVMAAKDFNDDRKDAGEIGAGHTVTALYELVPPGKSIAAPGVDPLKYQQNPPPPPSPPATDSNDLMTVKLRYKHLESDNSARTDIAIPATVTSEPSGDFKFTASVAEFGMLLRDSEYKGTATFGQALDLGQQGKGPDAEGYRAEFLNLVKTATALTR